MKGIVVCVHYDDLLAITLPRNMKHLDEGCLVVTSPTDKKTRDLVATVPGARLYETDAFYRYGAKFNKGLAIEEGFDALGRDGLILIWDADTMFPDKMPLGELRHDTLYSPSRLLLNNPKQWHPSFDWGLATPTWDGVFAGYFQLFHADDPHIREKPWYDVTFTHAGGGDGYFASRWPSTHKVRPGFKVLHLGPRDTNWCGRISQRSDGEELPQMSESNAEAMRAFLAFKGWTGIKTLHTFDEHVEVPGFKPTGFIP